MNKEEVIKYLKNSIDDKNNYCYSLPVETTKLIIKFIKEQQQEIDRLNNVISELMEDIPCLLEIINRNEKDIKVYQDEWIAVRSLEYKLKELKEKE